MKLLYRLFKIGYSIQQWWLRRLTTPGLACLICLMATAIIGIDTKQTTAYQILAFLLSALVFAGLFSLYFPGTFAVRRKLPRFATVGSKLIYSITIVNQSRTTQAGLLFIEEVAHPQFGLTEFRQIVNASNKKSFNSISYIYYRWLKAVSQKRKAKAKAIALPPLKPQSETAIKAEIMPTHRGVIRLSGITILRPDPFNLFNATKTIERTQTVLVLPKRYQIPTIALPGSRRSQFGSINQASFVGDSEEFVALRDYRPGDPWRKIHWKSWAKIDKPVVREEQNEYFVRQALILDTFTSQDRSEILEEAISVAASFACDWHTQESLLDLMFVGSQSYCFTSGRGLGDREQMLEILAGVAACRNKTFDCLTAEVTSKLSMLSGCICILTSWDERRRKLLDYLRGYDIPLVVLLIAEDEQKQQDLDRDIHILPVGKIQQALMSLERSRF